MGIGESLHIPPMCILFAVPILNVWKVFLKLELDRLEIAISSSSESEEWRSKILDFCCGGNLKVERMEDWISDSRENLPSPEKNNNIPIHHLKKKHFNIKIFKYHFQKVNHIESKMT